MRRKPSNSLGQRDRSEREGQVQESEKVLLASTGKSIITGSFVVPENPPTDIVKQITKLMAYADTFEGLEI